MADLRASDADRQRVIDALRTHTAEGRLTLDEFEERVGEALRASTIDDLRHVLRELPAPQAAVQPTPARPAARRAHRPSIPTPLFIALLVLGGSLLLGHFAWWLIPIGFWVTGGGGCHPAKRRHPARI